MAGEGWAEKLERELRAIGIELALVQPPVGPKPTDFYSATCDWGDCDEPAIDFRFDGYGHGWLVVCERHRTED